MGELAQQFLTQAEQQRVREAVQEAEKRTAGEIVVMVVSASHHYPMAGVRGALLALAPALALTPLIGGWLWLGHANLWVFLALAAVLGPAGAALVGRIPSLKRLLATRSEIDEEVREAAVSCFFNNRLYCTRDQSGVLVFISLLERKVWVLADKGIAERVGQDVWDQTVATITEGIRRRRACPAICAAVERVGRLLADHFPPRPDDTDELKGLILED